MTSLPGPPAFAPKHHPRRRVVPDVDGRRICVVLSAVGILAAAVLVAFAGAHARGRQTVVATAEAQRRPNVVFVLTDDLAWNLVTKRYMPHVIALEKQGMTFTNYFVTDSLCCPSRSSIFTGLVPHNTKVFKNKGEHGGYSQFLWRGLEQQTDAAVMHRSGYLASLMGKYLNGYGKPVMTTHVPPGWDDWHGASNGYPEFNYDLNENGTINHFGPPPPPPSNAKNYLTDVLSGRATAFINRAAKAHKPFMLEVASFAPHKPYVPAPRNANDFPGLAAPRDPAFNAANSAPPKWLGDRAPLNAAQIALIDQDFRLRAQSVEAVDRLIGNIEATLKARGLAGNTYIVFSSDNGYHMGQHRLLPGKQTAFDSDIRVPLIVAGPRVPRNRRISAFAENVDLYPTFLGLAGAKPTETVDGRSLLPLLHATPRTRLTWRTAVVIEHRGKTGTGDPDIDYGNLSGNPTSYEAVRLPGAVYVKYLDGEREYYDIVRDPFERHNVYGRLSAATKARLDAILRPLTRCHGSGRTSCWQAERPQPQSP
jgi:N-acetylglucosamine-6-sulfatase